MPRIELTTWIAAPVERCFDLSRSVELHLRSTAESGERAIAGVTSGLLGPGDEVTWRARHFGVWQTLSSRMISFERPRHFRDSMVEGAFRRFDHDHFFEVERGGTTMRDVFDYTSPLGALGRVADALFLERYMRRFLEIRNREIKAVAESDEWRRLLPAIGGEAPG
jgi:ligand-binding SRPBCC domain-containing protein